jgi:hypothetical protein
MGVGTSRLGRHGLGIVSVAVGVAALKTPSAFWVGVVVMLTAFWMLSGLTLGYAASGRGRAAWWGFTAAAAGCLMVSFGPWSDAERRSAWPDPWDSPSRSARLQPVSRVLTALLPLVRPQIRAEIRLAGDPRAVSTTLEVVGPFDRLEGLDPVRDRVAQLAPRLPLGGATPSERARLALDAATSSLSMSDYQAIGHMLAALGLGAIVALGVRLSAAGHAPVKVKAVAAG